MVRGRQTTSKITAMNAQTLKDASDYIRARTAYAQVAKRSEESRDTALRLREERQAAHARKIEAAENLIMTVLSTETVGVSRAGLTPFLTALTAGTNQDISTLFKVADSIALQ